MQGEGHRGVGQSENKSKGEGMQERGNARERECKRRSEERRVRKKY